MSNEEVYYPIYNFQYRLIIIGDQSVGKTCLLRYFVEKKRYYAIDSSVGVDYLTKVIEIRPNLKIKLHLWDTAGQERYKCITRSYYRNCAGIIIVYDITNHKSFESVTSWLKEAETNVRGPDPSQCVFLLVGHKADLQDKRNVLYEEGEYLAKYHKIQFIETSFFSEENTDEAFKMLAREINSRFESGALKLDDNWDGIKTGFKATVSLSEPSKPESGFSCC